MCFHVRYGLSGIVGGVGAAAKPRVLASRSTNPSKLGENRANFDCMQFLRFSIPSIPRTRLVKRALQVIDMPIADAPGMAVDQLHL